MLQLRLLELMNEIVSDSISVSPKIMELLKQKKTRDYIIKQFGIKQLFMMFEAEKKGKVLVSSFSFHENIDVKSTHVTKT